MNRIGALLLVMSMGVTTAAAQQPTPAIDGFAGRSYTSADGRTMPYRLFIPERYDTKRKYPLVLWLHGAGGSGGDNLQQISGDQKPGTRIWTQPKNQQQHPAFVLVPQARYGWDLRDLSADLEMVAGILEHVRSEFRIDPKRIYVAGQSNGGRAVWQLLTGRPNLFAAAIVVCNGGSFPEYAARIRQIPVWVFQGDMDAPHNLNAAVNMVAALRRAGGKPKYTEYANAGHGIWDRVFVEPAIVDWLFCAPPLIHQELRGDA